jgi:TonB family protein
MKRYATVLLFALLASARADVLTLRNGINLTGSWLGSDAAQIRFLVNDQVKTYFRSEVSEVTFGGAQGLADTEPAVIKPGETIDQVEAALGKPAQLFNMGAKQIYIYDVPPMKITFRDGKVAEIPSAARTPVAKLNAAGSAPVVPRSTAAATPPRLVAPAPAAPSAPKPASAAYAGAILTPLNPVTVDDALRSIDGATPAVIDFVNRSRSPVDIYWINYQGGRRLERAGLAVGATLTEYTFLTHPFLVVVSGAGGTTEQDTGIRLAAFQAVTPNITRDPAIRDTAIITNSDGTRAQAGNPVPTPDGAGTVGPGLGGEPSGSQPTVANRIPARVEPGTMGPDGIYSAGGGVSQPAVIQRVAPIYSEEARKAKYSGTVTLGVIVDAEGKARDIHVVRSLGMGLDEKAIEAVKKWKFRPAMKDGQPVPVRAMIEVNFRLL